MQLSIKALALAAGLLWGGAILLVGIAQQIWAGYGVAFLELGASVYPGYTVGGFGSVIVGTIYGFVDGAVGGAVFAWLYNLLSGATPAPSGGPAM